MQLVFCIVVNVNVDRMESGTRVVVRSHQWIRNDL